jgi:hypothetical protein
MTPETLASLTPYKDGVIAQLLSSELHSNPYTRGTDSFVYWARGWLDGWAYSKGQRLGELYEYVSKIAKELDRTVAKTVNHMAETETPKKRVKPYIVDVQFKRASGYDSSIYSYLCDLPNLYVDDYVIVDSPIDGFCVVRVVAVYPRKTKKASKWIVCKVDATQYNERKVREQRVEEIRKEIAKRKKRAEERITVEWLKTNDPSSKDLFDELESLDADVYA